MFDDSVDLVIWGHEHDCRIVPEPVAGKRYFISQPGSSVATSLAEGESIEKRVSDLHLHALLLRADWSLSQTCCFTEDTRQGIPDEPDSSADGATIRNGRSGLDGGR